MKLFLVLPIAAITFCASLGMAQQTSLGDVVRQNKPTKKAARVITNEDIPSRPEEAAVPSAANAMAAKTAEAGATGDAAAKPDDKARDGKEAKPAERSGKQDSSDTAAMKSRVKQLDNDIAGLTQGIKDGDKAIANEDDPQRREILENMQRSREHNLERSMAEREDIVKRLDDAAKKTDK